MYLPTWHLFVITVRTRLALGNHYDKLQLTEDEMKQLKEDIVQAKKFEYDLKRQMTRSIEDEYLKKLYDYKYNNNEHEERERLKQYHERLAFIQMRAEEKMRMEMKRAEEYEIQKLNIDQEALLKSEMQRMMNRRYLFHESERARELLEQKGLPMADRKSVV